MIALLIGGIAVLSVGFLAIAFGIPVKEFSFGNTMILAGSVVASAGLVLIGLSVVVRELKTIARRLDGRSAQPLSTHALPRDSVMAPRPLAAPPVVDSQKESRPAERKDEMLFSRDEPMGHEPVDEFDDFPDNRFQQPPLPSTNAPSLSASWNDERPGHARSDGSERGRRDILFASKRRSDEATANPSDDTPARDDEQGPDTLHSFENAWPQNDRPQRESQRRETEAPRERLQPPRRAEAASVSIVKSGVVDSMAYSLYSDGSIEAQTADGMVRFGSIEELRSHLDQR